MAVAVTAEIAKEGRSPRLERFPRRSVERTKQCLLDWFAVTVAGAQDELTDILVREAMEDGAKGPASLVGRSEKTLPSAAALINGAASHALDYDDVNFAMGGHPTVTVVPGPAGARRADQGLGPAVHRELHRRLRDLRPRRPARGAEPLPERLPRHRHRRLLLRDRRRRPHARPRPTQQLAVAFGIAATQAAGLKSNFGTMCKPLHAGTASEHGLRAARLAAKGFTARGDSLECDQGFASLAERPPRDRRGARPSRRKAGTCATTSSSIMRLLPDAFADRVRARRSGSRATSRRSA